MLPFVLPNSNLHLEFAKDGPLSPNVGDIVCFVGSEKKIVSHRIVQISRRGEGAIYRVKGDAQLQTEEIDTDALIAIVKRVDQPLFSYATNSLAGVVVSTVAVSTPKLVYRMASITRRLIRARRKVLDAASALFSRS